ncbi:MAG: hydrogenase formation protein HypD [Gemmataceae bacterium]
MKHLDEYRDARLAKRLLSGIAKIVRSPHTVMEVCGGQTHTLVRSGILDQLPENLKVVHGPGCPVCVTPMEEIDEALELAARPEVRFCSFGDMLRVPGSRTDLSTIRSQGGDVRIVYSPLDALEMARRDRDRQVVFFAVGFETTAPATALAVWQAKREGLTNFSLLVSHVLVPPALERIAGNPNSKVQGFLAAGHVCTVVGFEDYETLASHYRIPIVVTGFEPVDLLQGLWMLARQLEQGRYELENQYARVVRRNGNMRARDLLAEVYEVCDRPWRGLGILPRSGLRLTAAYREFDARSKFGITGSVSAEPTECRSGDVLQGLLSPIDCPSFGLACTPDTPLGAPMVSSEGACAAYFHHRRQRRELAVV